jgi:molybdopterin/thiamine biosynthesis adenylyltransferase/rhodanese-related sulfurtransferase
MKGVSQKIPPLVAPTQDLNAGQLRRYSRHILIPDLGLEGQLRIINARVLCVGAGGLGSPVLLYLAAAGVGTLGIVDFDVVDESNLHRQIIHGQSDVGRSKTESAKARIADVNPDVNVEIHTVRLDVSNVMSIFSQYDLIVDSTDNFATRYLINDACVLLNKPCVWGSIYRFDGQASVFWAKYGPCYRCLHPEPPPFGSVPNCEEGGVLGVLCGSIGSIQATEVIKLITGIGEPLVGWVMMYEGLEMTYQKVMLRKDPDCTICSSSPSQVELLKDYAAFCGMISVERRVTSMSSTITAAELKAKMDQKENFLLVDVREPIEWEIVRIPGSVLIPKGRFLDGRALQELPRDRPIILHCRSGVRSADCLEILLSAGFSDVAHLEGGVIGWVKEVDPSLPIY